MVAEADTEVAKVQEATEEEVAAGAGAGGAEEAVGAGVAGGWGPAPT